MSRKFGMVMKLMVAGALAVAALSSFAQGDVRCCTYSVRHNFRICLPNCPILSVEWTWHTQASAWHPFTTNIDSGTAIYPVPSTDTKCASATVGADCAFSSACATFRVDPIPGTPCIKGYHMAYGRACVRCRQFGANAMSTSKIVIRCGTPNAAGGIQWQPVLQDRVGGGCEVINTDPIFLHYEGIDGDVTSEKLFDLQASGFEWEATDADGDGWAESAKLKPTRAVGMGHIRIFAGGRSMTGHHGELRMGYENGIVTHVVKSGLFEALDLPRVGEPIPMEMRMPETFDLPFEIPRDTRLQSVEFGGGGQGGWSPVTGDVNGDGCVDDIDLARILRMFGQSGELPEDLNDDGTVDDADLAIVLENFGMGC